MCLPANREWDILQGWWWWWWCFSWWHCCSSWWHCWCWWWFSDQATISGSYRIGPVNKGIQYIWYNLGMVVMFDYKDKMKYNWSNLSVLVMLADFGVTFHSSSVFLCRCVLSVPKLFAHHTNLEYLGFIFERLQFLVIYVWVRQWREVGKCRAFVVGSLKILLQISIFRHYIPQTDF